MCGLSISIPKHCPKFCCGSVLAQTYRYFHIFPMLNFNCILSSLGCESRFYFTVYSLNSCLNTRDPIDSRRKVAIRKIN